MDFDKTFNLSAIYVTVTVYTNMAVVWRRTNQHSLFMGPLYRHGHLDAETYSFFFRHIAPHLLDCQFSPMKSWQCTRPWATASTMRCKWPAPDTYRATPTKEAWQRGRQSFRRTACRAQRTVQQCWDDVIMTVSRPNHRPTDQPVVRLVGWQNCQRNRICGTPCSYISQPSTCTHHVFNSYWCLYLSF